MKRREFIYDGSLTATALFLGPSIFPLGMKQPIGVQLWSVRDDIKTDPAGVIARIGQIGYDYVEGFGYAEGKFFGLSPAEFSHALDTAGLTMPSIHYPITPESVGSDGMLTDLVKHDIALFSGMGVKQVICPWIAEENRTLDKIKPLCDIFNTTAAFCRDQGLHFGYHNHDFEFKPLGDRLLYDHILGLTDPALVDLQMDLYWVVHANQNPILWINKAGGRVKSFHVKDQADTDTRETVEIGEGTIDFASIFAHCKPGSIQYYIVELEQYKRPPLDGIAVCLTNLRKLLP